MRWIAGSVSSRRACSYPLAGSRRPLPRLVQSARPLGARHDCGVGVGSPAPVPGQLLKFSRPLSRMCQRRGPGPGLHGRSSWMLAPLAPGQCQWPGAGPRPVRQEGTDGSGQWPGLSAQWQDSDCHSPGEPRAAEDIPPPPRFKLPELARATRGRGHRGDSWRSEQVLQRSRCDELTRPDTRRNSGSASPAVPACCTLVGVTISNCVQTLLHRLSLRHLFSQGLLFADKFDNILTACCTEEHRKT